MSVQAEMHDPKATYWYSTIRGNAFLLVKPHGNIFRVDRVMDCAYTIRIIKNNTSQAYAYIPQFGKTEVYKSGVRVTD